MAKWSKRWSNWCTYRKPKMTPVPFIAFRTRCSLLSPYAYAWLPLKEAQKIHYSHLLHRHYTNLLKPPIWESNDNYSIKGFWRYSKTLQRLPQSTLTFGPPSPSGPWGVKEITSCKYGILLGGLIDISEGLYCLIVYSPQGQLVLGVLEDLEARIPKDKHQVTSSMHTLPH
jgi:hypothetical protein